MGSLGHTELLSLVPRLLDFREVIQVAVMDDPALQDQLKKLIWNKGWGGERSSGWLWMSNGWPSWALQGLATESHKPMQCLSPSAPGTRPGRLPPQPTTQYSRKLQPKTPGAITPGILRQLFYPNNTLFPDSCFLARLPCFPTHCHHLTVLCTSIPAMSLGEISSRAIRSLIALTSSPSTSAAHT